MEWARLNVCQRLTRQWDAVHPYNAAQLMKLSGRADPKALDLHWRSTLAELGLGAVSARRRQFRWTPIHGADGAQGSVRRLAEGTSLDRFLSTELSTPFDDDRELPFRAFVLQEGEHYWAGVVYHHWVADSFSIRVLVREWFLRMFDPAEIRRAPLAIATASYWQSFGPGRCDWSLLGGLREMARWIGRLRTARRLSAGDFGDLRTHVTVHQAPAGLIGAVASQAKRQGVTVNDVFLSVLAELCDGFVRARGRDLALGNIVDLRARTGRLGEEFGLFLGFTSVFCRSDEIADFDRLLQAIHRQNVHQTRSAAAEASMLRMFGALLMGRLLSHRQLLEFYRRRVALAGGISNVSLNRAWPARYHPRPLLEYLRVSPCGPMLPVVLTPTTLGDRLNFGLTCRQSVISSAQAPEMARMFVSRLRRFADA